MSLVNRMLRDLDARHAGDGERAALPAAVTPLAARQEPGRNLPWLLIGTFLVAACVAGAWYVMRAGEVAAPVAAVPVRVPVEVVLAVPALPAAAPAATAEPAPGADSALPLLRMAGELSAAPAAMVEPPRKAVAAMPAIPAMPKAPERSVAGNIPSPLPVAALPKVAAAPLEARIEKQERLPSAAEKAEIDYRRGLLAQRQGNAEDASAAYRAALEHLPEHAAARQTLAALLIEAKRFDDAEELLRRGVELAPVRLASTMALARLKVERNQAPAALEILLKNAAAGARSAEFQGFAGALLNRAGRAGEAVERYQEATRLAPGEGRWWAGLGIALDAAGKAAEAREAYQRARALPGLPVDLAQHVEQRLR